jgi:hypothetical protein
MKLTGKYLPLLSLLCISGVTPASAAVIGVESMTITGGDVSLYGTPYQLLPGDITPMIMGEYQGSPACCSPDAKLTSLVYYEFGAFGWVGIHTSEFDEVSNQAPAPSAIVDTINETITVDLSAWTWSWNGHNYHQGNSAITGNYDPVTGMYDIAWNSVFEGGILNGQSQVWNLTGMATLSTVPLPATSWLFFSGLISLQGLLHSLKRS